MYSILYNINFSLVGRSPEQTESKSKSSILFKGMYDLDTILHTVLQSLDTLKKPLHTTKFI